MINYWQSFTTDDGYIYSVDMIRIKFELFERDIKRVNAYFNDINRLDINNYNPSFKTGTYKFLYTITYRESTMSVGFCLNGFNSTDKLKGFLEFNPNKTFCPKLLQDINFIRSCSIDFVLSRFDLAIDIPFGREHFVLRKDKRTYRLIENGKIDKTEYLGQKNKAGYTKLYNKTYEYLTTHRDCDSRKYEELPEITRLEITFDDSDLVKQLDKYFPNLYIVNPQSSLVINNLGLSKTQLVMCNAIKDSGNPEYYLKQLDDKRLIKKFREYIYLDDIQVTPDYKFVHDLKKLVINTFIGE